MQFSYELKTIESGAQRRIIGWVELYPPNSHFVQSRRSLATSFQNALQENPNMTRGRKHIGDCLILFNLYSMFFIKINKRPPITKLLLIFVF